MRSPLPPEDALDLQLRLVRLFFRHAYGADPAGFWFAPAPAILLGGRAGGSALAVPMRWGARVAAGPRTDTAVLALSAHRPLDPVGVDVDYEGVAELPGWAADIPRVARGVLGCGREVRGAALLAYVDVPEESGLGAEAARRCGLARAMAGVSGTAVTPDELLLLLEGEGWQAAANAACLLGRRGQAVLIPAGFRGCARMLCHTPFDPAAVGVRLVAMTLRPVEPEAPDPEWEPDLSEDARVVDGFEALLAGGPEGMERLGELLSESHQACHGRRERAAADRVVAMALSAGALGARATSPSTILALVPASALRSLRTAVVDAFRNRGLPVPRFLTTGAAAAAVSEPPESLLEA